MYYIINLNWDYLLRMNYGKSCLGMSTMLLRMRRNDEDKGRAIFARELGVPIVMHKYLTGGFTANPRKENSSYFNFICFTE